MVTDLGYQTLNGVTPIANNSMAPGFVWAARTFSGKRPRGAQTALH